MRRLCSPLFIVIAITAAATTVLLAQGNTAPTADAAPLLVAIRNGGHAQAQKLLAAGSSVNAADSEGTTALMHAVIESDATMAKLLIERGADVNARNTVGSTALLYGSVSLEKARLLLDAGADPRVRNKLGATPMSTAARAYRSTPVLKLLMAKGAVPENGMMNSVAQKGDLEAIQFLIAAGVNPREMGNVVSSALIARCDECVKLLVDQGAPVSGLTSGQGVLNNAVKRSMTDIAQYLVEHGASLESKDREGFTLLMQAVLSMEPQPQRDRMVQWVLSKGVDPNAVNDRGDTAYQLAARLGTRSTLDLLLKAGAKEVKEDWPKPSGPALTARAAVTKILPTIEMTGEPVFKARQCVSCHNNSLPAMAVALARQKGFNVNEEQAQKELGFAVATQKPFLEPMRTGTTIGGGTDTLGYTLMGMAAAGYAPDALTDAHIHYLATYQHPDGYWTTTSYRTPAEYGPFTSTSVALLAARLYPIPGRRAEFEDRYARARKWLLSTTPTSIEERTMHLLGLAAAGASLAERAPAVKALKALQNPDGSWNQLRDFPSDAMATSKALYVLHVAGGVPVSDPVYQKGIAWLLRNQLPDGSWFTPTRALPVQPHTFESGFPHGWSQFVSNEATSWALLDLLFTLPDSPTVKSRQLPAILFGQ